jgi:hypothetical protein
MDSNYYGLFMLVQFVHNSFVTGKAKTAHMTELRLLQDCLICERVLLVWTANGAQRTHLFPKEI